MTNTIQPKHFAPGEGKTFKIGRMSMTFKTTVAEGWNTYTVCEAIEPAESGAGYHRHPTYDETFIISSPGGIFDAMIAELTMRDTGSPTRQASEDARAIATRYGLEFVPG